MDTKSQKFIRWTKSEFDLRYEISDIRLFTKTFRGVISTFHFLDFEQDELLKSPAKFLSKYDVQVALMNSCPVSRSSKRISVQDGVIVYCMARYDHHYVNVQNSFEGYLGKFKSKTRATLKKKVHKFIQDGQDGTYFRKFKTATEMDTFLKLAAVVSAKTYQHRLFDRGIPSSREFRRGVMEQAERNLVRGYLLYLGGIPVAYTFAPFVSEGVILYDYNGYDPEFGKLSPGTVIQYKVIEDLCLDSDAKTYDLCIGEDEHKTLFSTNSTYCADILILRSSLGNMLIVFTHHALAYVSAKAGIFLDRLQLKRRLKKLIRRGAQTGESAPQEVSF